MGGGTATQRRTQGCQDCRKRYQEVSRDTTKGFMFKGLLHVDEWLQTGGQGRGSRLL